MEKIGGVGVAGQRMSDRGAALKLPQDVAVSAEPVLADRLDLVERTERARHLFRLRNNLANGSADALNAARACLTFDPARRGAGYVERFAASIDTGAKSGNTSRGGRQEREAVLRDIAGELVTLGVAYEEAFATDVYRELMDTGRKRPA